MVSYGKKWELRQRLRSQLENKTTQKSEFAQLIIYTPPLPFLVHVHKMFKDRTKPGLLEALRLFV